MKKSTLFFIFFLIVLVLGLGALKFYIMPRYLKKVEQVQAPVVMPSITPVASPVSNANGTIPEAVLAKLTPTEKINQLILYSVVVTASDSGKSPLNPQELKWIAENNPGVVALFGKDISASAAAEAIKEIKAAPDQGQKLVPLIATDHEGGQVQRLSGPGFTKLPAWATVCKKSPSVRQNLLNTSAAELQKVGIDIVLGPVGDVASQSSSLQDRICGSDSQAVQENADAFMTAFQKVGITPVLKHYPGIGSLDSDLHETFQTMSPDLITKNVFLNLLQKYPSAGVMTAHVGILDQNSQQPCSLSSTCLADLSKFSDALVITDGLEMKSARYNGVLQPAKPIEEAAVQALYAGNDVLTFSRNTAPATLQKVQARLLQEYTASSAFQQRVNASALKIIKKKLEPKG